MCVERVMRNLVSRTTTKEAVLIFGVNSTLGTSLKKIIAYSTRIEKYFWVVKAPDWDGNLKNLLITNEHSQYYQ